MWSNSHHLPGMAPIYVSLILAPDLCLVSRAVPSCSLSDMLVHHVLLLICLDMDAGTDRTQAGCAPQDVSHGARCGCLSSTCGAVACSVGS